MAGRSKWANIKHRKGRQDARRAKIWSRCSRAIIVAAQQGGPDPEFNVTLRYAIDAAKAANMPKDNISKAIKKGSGQDGSSERYEEVRYEGYGPGGVAIIVDTLISNPQKTAPEIRSLFDKNGGKQAVRLCLVRVHPPGPIYIDGNRISEEDLMELALEAGAEDIVEDGGLHQVTTSPLNSTVKAALEEAGLEFESAEINGPSESRFL